MNKKQQKSLIVGVFVMAGIFLFIFSIYLIGKKEYLIGSPIQVSAIFSDVNGLREGDKVLLSGIDIGTVSSLSFMQDNRVLVNMYIGGENASFVKKDSRVTIGSEGLMGSKLMRIIPGSPESGPIEEFDTLQAVVQAGIDEILLEVNTSSKNIAIVSEELVSITKKINRGDGVFGKIFTDTTLTRNLDDAILNIAELTNNLNEIMEDVNTGKGVMGKLFADTLLTNDLGAAGKHIDDIARNLSEITQKINQGQGIFGRMFTDTSLTKNLYITSQNLQLTTQSLSVLAEKLSSDSSALNLMIDDPDFADSLEVTIQRLNTGLIEVTEAADAVQRSGLIRLFSKKKKE